MLNKTNWFSNLIFLIFHLFVVLFYFLGAFLNFSFSISYFLKSCFNIFNFICFHLIMAIYSLFSDNINAFVKYFISLRDLSPPSCFSRLDRPFLCERQPCGYDCLCLRVRLLEINWKLWTHMGRARQPLGFTLGTFWLDCLIENFLSLSLSFWACEIS